MEKEIQMKENNTVNSEIRYCVDIQKSTDSDYQIQGWAAEEQKEIKIEVYDKANREVACRVDRINRPDVNAVLNIKQDDYKAGFNLFIEKPVPYKKVDVVFSDAENRKSVEINLKQLDFAESKIGKIRKSILEGGLKTVYTYSKTYGFRKTIKKVAGKLKTQKTEDQWLRQHLCSQKELDRQRKIKFDYMPLISIVVPLYNTPINYLKELIDSIQKQSYVNWQLCLADASTIDDVEKYIKRNYAHNSKIIYKRLNSNKGISDNTNEAIRLAEGEWIAFADHDDLLTLDALFECVKAMNSDLKVDAIYSDEDKITVDGKQYFQPHFKSDYNIDLLCSMNYICHLYVVRKSLMDKVGWLDSSFDGAQDYDFVLRSTEKARRIYHIPRILYHWRAHKNSTAENPESKMYAFEAGKRAVQAHYDRMNIPAEVSHGEYLGLYRTKYHWDEKPMISIIIPNKDHIDDLEKCIQSIESKSTYRNYEYIIVENNSTEKETFDYYKQLEKKLPYAHVVYYDGDFNFSLINNFGVKYAKGSYYLLLNNDTEIINPDCLEQMLGYCMRDEVGIVGARLYYNDDTVQHAGVVIGFGGIAGHTFIGMPRSANGYFSRIICAQDYSAVTAACMMVKKSVYEEVDGLSPELKVAFNDIDFCLKVRAKGYLVVYNPYAELYHYESKSRGLEDTPEKVERFNREIKIFSERWPDILRDGDPYYNVNLSLNRSDFGLKE